MSGPVAVVAAQAKVNLFLHVRSREASGYHQIETLFCRLALADDVLIRVTSGQRSLDCDAADAGPPALNLAYRAAAAYSDKRGWPPGFAIEITKRVPVGGGLGGGSADAGAVLRALRALDSHPPSPSTILELAAELGADVPAVTIDAPLALAWGRGERLLSLPALPSRAVILYAPTVRVATREAYGWLDEWIARPEMSGAHTRPRVLRLAELARWETLAPLMMNDFERPVWERHPEIGRAAEELRRLPSAYGALMSGSGSAVYCVLRDHAPDRASVALPESGMVVVTSTADHVVGVRRIE